MDEIRIMIKMPPMTKKNHSQIIFNKKTGKRMVIPSKQYKEYEQACLWQIRKPAKPVDVSVNVKCVYYMPTHRRVDLCNLIEATMDILVLAGVLADDNSSIAAAHDGSRVLYDKDEPRTEITITELYE